ncbi:AraC family transcriptional regulator [Aureibacter tunicatorum]|uniref:AraC-like DNA-binding protein/mannose-6-phosphate isomerase-like protein (Cupin superfamily) n=1 Tax=Aureibacter tunicatorum TaxID=866807 RepID=A0AAE4BSU4_9BACT|nr:AraC family transcriptional regulator [Aureibacter tunicatorum]MDR6239245.1 AraC-like DNA-binding protein/mannose-6-phosphate isomerase-like protein (cupin superfamily) [Aureibacter tunicatorum]BDD04830.1 transcriptional regulator [Aureibacter tunicatorum]
MKEDLPIYTLNQFESQLSKNKPYQVEIFDANRHFEVEYPHKHDFFEVLFLTNGSGCHIIDSNRYDINPPCVFFLSPGQAHKLELSKDISGYLFLFTDEFYLFHKSNKNQLLELPFFFNINQENPPLQFANAEDVNFLIQLFKRGCKLMAENQGFLQIEAILDTVLNTCWSLYPNSPTGNEQQKGHLLVKRFRQLIEENYQENLNIQQYAELLNISPNHLTHIVKKVLGKTSLDLIKERNIIEIKRLLIHTDLSVTQIADRLNFNDQSYLTKFFKKNVGITPAAFRNNR